MKNKILRRITAVMGIVFVIGATAIDSPNKTIPMTMCIIPLVWMLFLMAANKDATIEEVLGR